MSGKKKKVAIIGGGLSGLVSAEKLQEAFDITLFEKARGVGGRMSTRRAEPYQFDHGAQYFTARSKSFQDFLKPHLQSGLVRDWTAKVVSLEKGQKPYKREWFEAHYVCAPRMNSLCKHLAESVELQFSVEISKLTRADNMWMLDDTSKNTYGPFDWVIMTAPSHQAAILLPDNFCDLDSINDVQMTGCYSVMLGFEKLPKLNWDIAIPKNSIIGWMAVNSSKPERKSPPSVLIQTTNEWAEKHMNDNVPDMETIIIREYAALTGTDLHDITHQSTHRWRYANTELPASKPYFTDHNSNIGVCGDWCIAGRVESAFLSADQLCKSILRNE